jgi:hypothetical protein
VSGCWFYFGFSHVCRSTGSGFSCTYFDKSAHIYDRLVTLPRACEACTIRIEVHGGRWTCGHITHTLRFLHLVTSYIGHSYFFTTHSLVYSYRLTSSITCSHTPALQPPLHCTMLELSLCVRHLNHSLTVSQKCSLAYERRHHHEHRTTGERF